MLMFKSRNEWFSHELKVHRREWFCQFCENETFPSKELFSSHTVSNHQSILDNSSLDALLLQSEQQVERIPANACHLCNDWEENLRRKHPSRQPLSSAIEDGNIYGQPKQFRRHLGRHMEQIALFALPRSNVDDLEDDSSQDDVSGLDDLDEDDPPDITSTSAEVKETELPFRADLNANTTHFPDNGSPQDQVGEMDPMEAKAVSLIPSSDQGTTENLLLDAHPPTTTRRPSLDYGMPEVQRRSLISERIDVSYSTLLSYAQSLTEQLRLGTLTPQDCEILIRQSVTAGMALRVVVRAVEVQNQRGSSASELLHTKLHHQIVWIEAWTLCVQEDLGEELINVAAMYMDVAGACVTSTKSLLDRMGNVDLEEIEAAIAVDRFTDAEPVVYTHRRIKSSKEGSHKSLPGSDRLDFSNDNDKNNDNDNDSMSHIEDEASVQSHEDTYLGWECYKCGCHNPDNYFDCRGCFYNYSTEPRSHSPEQSDPNFINQDDLETTTQTMSLSPQSAEDILVVDATLPEKPETPVERLLRLNQDKDNAIAAFQEEGRAASYTINPKETHYFEELRKTGHRFGIDIAEIGILHRLVQQLKSNVRAKDSRGKFLNLEDIHNLINEGIKLEIPGYKDYFNYFQEQRDTGIAWEAKARELIDAEVIDYSRLEDLSAEAKYAVLPVSPDTLATVNAILEKQLELSISPADDLKTKETPFEEANQDEVTKGNEVGSQQSSPTVSTRDSRGGALQNRHYQLDRHRREDRHQRTTTE